MSRMAFIERAERAERDLAIAHEALRAMRLLAAVSHEGDTWFASQAGLDADVIFAQARRVLGEPAS